MYCKWAFGTLFVVSCFTLVFSSLGYRLSCQADEIKFCNDEAAKSTARALAAKNTKGSLKEEQGSLKAQLSHQV